jgi:hypothetical protein
MVTFTIGASCAFTASVVLLNHATGAIIRTIGVTIGGSKGTGRWLGVEILVTAGPAGLRFTLDGVSILVDEYSNKRLSKFYVADGTFEDFYCQD